MQTCGDAFASARVYNQRMGGTKKSARTAQPAKKAKKPAKKSAKPQPKKPVAKAKAKPAAKAKAPSKPAKATPSKPAKAAPKKRAKTAPVVSEATEAPLDFAGDEGGEGGDKKPGPLARVARGVGNFFAKVTGRKPTEGADTDGAAGTTMEITTEEIIVSEPVGEAPAPKRSRKKPPPPPGE
jgi:hypothetical protein